MQYALTEHQLGKAISNLLLSVALQETFLGLNWLLSIEKNTQLGVQFKTATCNFIIQRYYPNEYTPYVLDAIIGKLLNN